MISYMTADVYFAMWLEEKRATDFELAMTHYSQAIAKFPDSKLTERTLLLMGYSYLEKGEALNTLRLFQRHLRERPESPNRDVASLALANAYLKLNRYDDANDVYLNMEQNAKGKSARIEACYLKGDVWFQKKDFGKSIVEYKNAIQKYPEVTSKYPNAFYNSAEAFFWMGEYKKSLEAYTDYLIRFPSDTHAGYAMTRVGELLEILGADKSRVVGVYLETYFRYGDTPGANVAKVRLLSQKMKGMKEKEMLDQIKETKDLVDKSTLPKIQEFATVMIAEGYTRRSEYDKSLDLLSKYYADNPTTANLPLLASRILDNIARKMRDYMSEEKFLEILKVHKAYGESWLKNADRLDIGYFIAEAYEQAGVPLEAEKWLKSTLHKLKNAAQSNQLMERKVFEFLPTEDEVQLHLARVLFESHKYQQSLEALRAIKNPENLTEKDQILRVEVAAKLFDKKGVVESSRRYMEELISVWQGKPELIASVYLQLAELNIQSGKPQEGIKDLIALSQLAAESKKVPPAIHSRALEMLGSQYVLAGKTDEAIGTYTQLLDTYEKTRPLESIRYRLGELHFKKGNLQQAAEVWKPLAEGKTKLWSSLAQEQLSGSNWEKDYKKYIQRIPAMVDRK